MWLIKCFDCSWRRQSCSTWSEECWSATGGSTTTCVCVCVCLFSLSHHAARSCRCCLGKKKVLDSVNVCVCLCLPRSEMPQHDGEGWATCCLWRWPGPLESGKMRDKHGTDEVWRQVYKPNENIDHRQWDAQVSSTFMTLTELSDAVKRVGKYHFLRICECNCWHVRKSVWLV